MDVTYWMLFLGRRDFKKGVVCTTCKTQTRIWIIAISKCFLRGLLPQRSQSRQSRSGSVRTLPDGENDLWERLAYKHKAQQYHLAILML